MKLDNDRQVDLFKELIRFRTISAEGPHTGAYKECCEWLVKTNKELLGVDSETIEPVPGHPIVVTTIPGKQPTLPSVVLNSHYDVVPVMREQWHVDPFAAEEKDGKIYGRGTQDMKCVCIQYVLALQQLMAGSNTNEPQFERTIHLVFVPDEEIGGTEGMKAFIDSGEFTRLCSPVGIVLDEGLANPKDEFTVFYGERSPRWIIVTASGPTGHGSRFIPDTAVQRLLSVANKATEYRMSEEKKLGYPEESGCKHCEAVKLGDVTTINLTMLRAGVSLDEGKTFSLNVIPTKAEAGFDIRVSPTFPIKKFEEMLNEWTAAEGLTWEYAPWTSPTDDHQVSSIDGTTNPWWTVFNGHFTDSNQKVIPEIFPAATDSRFLRESGHVAFGFSPMKRSPILLHEHNEYLERTVFLEGVKVYEGLIPCLANNTDDLQPPSSKKTKST